MRQARLSSLFPSVRALSSVASSLKRSAGRARSAPRETAVRAAAFTAVESLEQRTLMAFSALVNFQPAASPTPAGYVADAGLVYGDRGNGFTYGWDAVNTAGLRDRNHGTSPDQRYDTLAHTQFNGDNRTWDLAVPNGQYVVRIVAGDPSSLDSVYAYDIEGELSVNAAPLAARKWIESSAYVTVSDGKLTVSNAANAFNSKIDFIEVYSAADQTVPSVTDAVPGNGQTGVLRDTFIGVDLLLPGGALDPLTVDGASVKLYRSSDNLLIPANVNTSGGGDSIVLQPTSLLEPNTAYYFTIGSGVKDVGGNAIIPFSMSFTTGTGPGPVASDIQFQKVALTNTNGNTFSAVEIGPDGKLYAGTIEGRIIRYSINPDGTLGTGQVITTIMDANGGPRLLAGFAFDPASTANNLVMYVVHNDISFNEPAMWSGVISRLSGADLQNYQDVITHLPRADHNHVTNQPKFGPDGALYVAQGGNTAQGAQDAVWGLRPEALLSAAVLRIDPSILSTNTPLNVQTEGVPTPYNPWAANAPVKLYATGIRNAWDLIWTQDGKMYAAGNGSNPGGAAPATPALPIPGSIRIDGDDDGDPSNGMYSGPAVPGLDPVTVGQNDYLSLVVQGGYYGHPNPTRHEYVLNGGNPTAGTDYAEVKQYPVGTLPDRNFRGYAFDFGAKRSPNGSIEYRSDKFGGALQGRLLIVRFSGGDDIIVLTRDAAGNVVSSQTGLTGLTGFTDPLDLIEDPTTGNIYVAEYGGRKLTLLKPLGQEPPATPTSVVASVVSPMAAKVTWDAILGAGSYRIQRRGPGEQDFTDYATSTTNSFDDLNVLPTNTYEYRVRGENTFGPSAYSAPSAVNMPATGLWSTGVPLPNNMAELGGAIINGKMYVAGENNQSTWEFDFGTQEWTARAVRPFTGDSTNAEHATETVGGLLYLVGGLSGGSENKVQIFDPATNSWTLGADRSYNAGSSLSAVIGGQIYVTGGAVTVPTYAPVAKTSKYDPATNTWTALADMPLPRHSAAAGTDGAKLYVFGGRNAGLEASDGTNTVQVYDPATNTWQTSEDPNSVIPRMPRPMRGASIKAIFYKGEFYIFGGENSSGNYGATADKVFDRVDIYNSTTRTWRLGEPMPTARHATIAVLHQNKIYIVGGGIERGTSASDMVEVFDLLANVPPTIPNVPTNLVAVAASSRQVDLDWDDASTNETGFQVWRSIDGTSFSLLTTVAKNVSNHRDTTAQPETHYYYYVQAVNAAGPSGPSNTADVITPQLTIPAAPGNLIVTATSPSQIQLAWNESGGATIYHIERKGPNDADFFEIATTTNTTYISGGLLANSSYAYRISAGNELGTSPYSAEAAATTPELIPFTSQDIDASPSGTTTVIVPDKSWDVTAGGRDIWNASDSFRFLYEQRSGDFDMMVQIPSILQISISTKAGLMAREGLDPGSRHVFVGATPADGYRFAFRDSTNGNTSNAFSGGTPNFPDVYLRLRRAGDVFTAYYSSDGANWAVMNSRTMNLPETVYFGLAVSARNGSTSAMTTVQFRNLVSPVPAAPTNLDASSPGATSINLTWDATAGATSYLIDRKGPGEVDFTQVGTSAVASYADTTVLPSSQYTYRVRAANSVGTSPASQEISETSQNPSTVPAAPTGLIALAVSQSLVLLHWEDSGVLETGFQIWRSPDGGTYTQIGSVAANTTGYSDNTAVAGKRYFYKIKAFNVVGPSAASRAMVVTTPTVDSYTSTDINAVPTGDTRIFVADKHYDLVAGGTDIWDNADSFRFAYRQLTGDFDYRVQVQSLSGGSAGIKAGLMARESLAPGSRHVFSATTAADGFRLSYRANTNGQSNNKYKGGTVAYPQVWLRLKRTGNVFTGYVSTDAVNWTQMSTVTLALPTTLYFGMAATGKSATTRATAEFRNLGVTTATAPSASTIYSVSPFIVANTLKTLSTGSTGARPAEDILK